MGGTTGMDGAAKNSATTAAVAAVTTTSLRIRRT